MFPEETVTLAQSGLVTTMVGAGVALLAGAGAALFAVPKIAERILPSPRETRLHQFLPFHSIAPDGVTVTFKDGSAARFYAISGFDQAFLSDAEGRMVFRHRKNAIDALAEYGVQLRIFTYRDPVRLAPAQTHANPIASEIARRWNRNFENAFVTKTVICVSMKSPGKDFVSLDEACTTLSGTLKPYNPVLLSQRPDAAPSGDLTIGAFLGRLVSPVSRPQPNAFGDGLDEALAADEIEFLRNGRIRFRSGDETLHASVIGIRRFGDVTSTGLASELAAINGEIMILQTVEPQPKVKALLTLKQNQQMMSATSFSADVWSQYATAIALVDGMDEDKACLCQFSETIFVYARSEVELKELEKTIRQILTNYGVTSVIETGASQASWFMQFPTYDIKPRVYRLMSINVAQLATFDRTPSGLPRSSWGEGPIALFYTGANSVYSHQFHISTAPGAVGHGLCIAPTGAGKTTLIQMLSCMASRHKDLKHFFFDRFEGTYIYTTAMGGRYLSFNNEPRTLSVPGGMNPFQCEPTRDNIEFLKVWLRAISRPVGGKPLDDAEEADAIDQIANAVQIAFDSLETHERSLAEVHDAAFTPGSRIKSALQKWVDPAQYGSLFNASEDCISLDDNWLTTFDMTNLLSDELLGGAAISYIMHRIRETLRRKRAPGFIFVDETEPLLRHPDFKKIYLVMLQEFRKLEAVVISVFQRPQALRSSGISEAVRQQCGTYYLFPNPGASAEDYAEFDLTERELGFVLGMTEPARRIQRGLLIKRPMTRESVIVDIDFTCLGPYLKFFSSSTRDVAMVDDLQRQFGARWVEKIIDPEAP